MHASAEVNSALVASEYWAKSSHTRAVNLLAFEDGAGVGLRARATTDVMAG
jgi:hypothetical protein